MRADAKKNYDHLLNVAREVVAEQGADASLRDIARKAGLGLGTLYRHFPTREALLEALLRTSFDVMASRAGELESAEETSDALVSWLREMVGLAHNYSGAITSMVAAIEDEGSALHASCTTMKSAGTRLLLRAQADGTARPDMDGAKLFALVGALAWIHDQPALETHSDKLFDIISGAILTDRQNSTPEY